ncbi:MAG: AmmeMemoRadiSam system radical SAM enzyme [Candidatus Nanoarchaeia archaeon]
MQAKNWKKFNDKIKCMLCPHSCIISESKSGICKVRKNISGNLQSQNYGKPITINIDPIEKKPFYHFLPKTPTLSIGTVGCNLKCLHCQNWEISTAAPGQMNELDLPPEVVVQLAIDKGCNTIAYTYNEPTIYHEYAIDIARLAKQKGIKNIIVTNGFISKQAAEEFAEVMDGANIDLKAFNNEFYKDICKGSLQPVLEAIKIYSKNMWIEITNLIIDGKNDSIKEIEEMCKWISKETGTNTPIHFSRAIPMHRMQNISPTPKETLLKARDIAKKYLNFVYIGNTATDDGQNTSCPRCGKMLISRTTYETMLKFEGGACPCGEKISGVWK